MTQETLKKAIKLNDEKVRVDKHLEWLKVCTEKDDVKIFTAKFDKQFETDIKLIDVMIKWLQDKGIELREEIENL